MRLPYCVPSRVSEDKWLKRSSEWVVLLLLLVLCLLLIVMLLVMLLRGWVACHLLCLGWIEQFVSPLPALSPFFCFRFNYETI